MSGAFLPKPGAVTVIESPAPDARLGDLIRSATGVSASAEAAVTIANDAGLRRRAAELLPRIQRETAPCSSEEIERELRRLLAVYHVSEGRNKNWNDFWSIYCQALNDLCLSALRAGIDAFIKASDYEYFPKPGPLRELCLPRQDELKRALSVVELALRIEALPEGASERERARQVQRARLLPLHRHQPASSATRPAQVDFV